MTVTAQLVLNRWEDLYVPGNPNDSRLLHSDPSDRISTCPPHLGQGYFQEILLRDDLTLVILDYTLHQDVSIDVFDKGDRLEFEFQLVGADAGYSFFVPYLGLRQFGIKPARRRWFKVEVFFNRPALTTYFHSFVERLSPQVQDLVSRILRSMYYGWGRRSPLTNSPRIADWIADGAIPTDPHSTFEQLLTDALYSEAIALKYASRSPITAAMQQIIEQILTCPYQGATRRTYLEQKALKLVALRLEAMIPHHPDEVDLGYIYEAGSILRKQLVAPPTVEKLARQVGTNRLKLNQGFHQVYGTTPGGYLRDCRLMQARRLLMTSELPIASVATAVGYTSRSRFATAFRREFGINPKVFQMQAWRWAS